MNDSPKTCEASIDYKIEYAKVLASYIELRKTELIYKDVIENLGILLNNKNLGGK
ncbi:MAG: hypothetical protein WCS56_00275 [Bacilli bacterium]